MKKWNRWRSEYSRKKYDVIIIGSGISGLTSGILLAQKGKKVLILEKHFKAGGWTHTFKRKNYEWDVGIHYVGQVHKKHSPARKLFDIITNNELQWNKMDDNYDRIIFPDQQFNFISPRSHFIEQMVEYFPESKRKILEYINQIDESVKSSQKYFGNKALPKLLSQITYMPMTNKFFKYSNKTTKEVIMNIFNDKKILGVLTGQWGDYGLPPGESSFAMHAMVVRHYLDGASYPIGTSRRISETASNYLESLGGELYVNADVDEIIVHKNKAIGVRLSSGDEINASTIISSTGIINTYKQHLRNYSDIDTLNKNLININPTGSYLCLYMGINKSIHSLDISNTNLWVYPGYDHDKNVKLYNNSSDSELPLVYISFPSAKDPSFMKKYPNHTTMEAITISKWQDYNRWKGLPWKNRGEEYEKQKVINTKKILEVVYKNVPQIKNNIDYHELSTPLTVKSLANYQHGEIYGLDHSPLRFQQRWLRPKSPIRNLYLTGQDIVTVGVTGALFSGLLTSSSILKKNLMKEIL